MLMKSSRRHESLIPLSREHHYGLMLCLRLHKGLPQHGPQHGDEAWAREQAARVAQFFATDLAPHFQVEEEALFPAMKDFAGASELVDELFWEHRKMEALVERLRDPQTARLAPVLLEFADLLESHIRKEERELFPIYERQMKPEVAVEVERAVIAAIGEALQPKAPQLLR